MDLGRALIESNKKKKKGAWKGYAGSIAAHGALIGLVVFAGMTATKDVVAEELPRKPASPGW